MQTNYLLRRIIAAVGIAALCGICPVAAHQEGHTHPDEHAHPPPAGQQNLAKASQNPVSSLISVPFENNANFKVGPGDDYANVLNIKPVVPVSFFGTDWNLINRVILPIVYQNFPVGGDGGGEWGTANAIYQGFFTRKKAGKFIWGVGPQIGIPTSSDRRFGSAAVGVIMPGKWVIGGVVS
jgi:hypothetical protein